MADAWVAVIVIVALLLAGGVGYYIYEKKDESDEALASSSSSSSYSGPADSSANHPSQINAASSMPNRDLYPSQQSRLDLLQGGRVRSKKSTGYSADDMQGCYNENLVGSVQAPYDPKVGSSRCSFPSAPMGSKPIPLASNRLSGKRLGAGYGGVAKRTGVDLSEYQRVSQDRAMGAQGLDLPEDLALASVQLGHVEQTEPTRTDSQHPWGETPSSWRVGYSVNTSGHLEPGNGIIPQLGPALLAQRMRGVGY